MTTELKNKACIAIIAGGVGGASVAQNLGKQSFNVSLF